jgi:hypothetical protein
MKKRKIARKKNLISDRDEVSGTEDLKSEKRPIISYWWQNVTLAIVPTMSQLSPINQPILQKGER